MADIKISQLPAATTITGLYTLATDDENKSVKVSMDILRGATGETGADGAPGQAATITVGTTTTGEAGTEASVTNSGTSGAAVLNFVIPRGATGPEGPAGTVQYKTLETINIYDGSENADYDIEGVIIGKSGFQSGTKAFWGLGMSLNTSEGTKNQMIGCYSIPTEAGAATYVGSLPIYRRLLPSGNSFSINPGDIVTKNLTATGSCSLGSLDYDGGTIGWQAGAVATITTLGAYNLNFTDPDTAGPTGSSTMYFGPGYDNVNPTTMAANQICVYTIAYDGQHFLINRAIYTNKNA